MLKFFEVLAAENADVRVVSMHPGVGESILSTVPVSRASVYRGGGDVQYSIS